MASSSGFLPLPPWKSPSALAALVLALAPVCGGCAADASSNLADAGGWDAPVHEIGTGEPDEDAGCTCIPDGNGGSLGILPLACFCGGDRSCSSYETALTNCPPGAHPAFYRIKLYETCNRVAITSGGGFDGSTFIYDATTHELLGASSGTDVPILPCGKKMVFGYRAGTFPPDDCQVTQDSPRCPVQ